MHLHYLTRFTTAHGRLAEGERAFQWWRRDFGMGWGDLEKQKAYPSRFPKKSEGRLSVSAGKAKKQTFFVKKAN